MQNVSDIKIIDMVSLGQEKDVEKLIEAGFDVNERDEYGNYPVIEAASRNDLNILRRLAAAGAKLNVFNRAGQTPLMWAEIFENQEMIDFIERSGS